MTHLSIGQTFDWLSIALKGLTREPDSAARLSNQRVNTPRPTGCAIQYPRFRTRRRIVLPLRMIRSRPYETACHGWLSSRVFAPPANSRHLPSDIVSDCRSWLSGCHSRSNSCSEYSPHGSNRICPQSERCTGLCHHGKRLSCVAPKGAG